MAETRVGAKDEKMVVAKDGKKAEVIAHTTAVVTSGTTAGTTADSTVGPTVGATVGAMAEAAAGTMAETRAETTATRLGPAYLSTRRLDWLSTWGRWPSTQCWRCRRPHSRRIYSRDRPDTRRWRVSC